MNSFHPRGGRRTFPSTNQSQKPHGERQPAQRGEHFASRGGFPAQRPERFPNDGERAPQSGRRFPPKPNAGHFGRNDERRAGGSGERPPHRGGERFPANRGEHFAANRGGERFPANRGGEHFAPRSAERRPLNRGGEHFANRGSERFSANRGGDFAPNRNAERRPPNRGGEHFAPNRGGERFPSNPNIERASFGSPSAAFSRAETRPERPRRERFAAEHAPRSPGERPRTAAPDPRRAPLTPEREAAIAASPFRALGLSEPVVRALLDENYAEPTPVQAKVIPGAAAGRDVLASAQTGTGKTAAFVLPILHQLAADATPHEGIQALVLTPTRELAAQIAERVSAYGRYLGIRYAVVYGGVSQFRQERALAENPRLLVATPGRLLDLMQQGLVRLGHVRHFVLDEADRMLDMGFIHDVRRVVAAVPKAKQTLLFSATVPRPIEALAQGLLKDPVRVDITPAVKSAETVEQSVVFVQRDQKSALLERLLQKDEVERAIVFTRTKHGANRLSQRLEKLGLGAPAIHGNKSQNARERALSGFRGGKTRILVATDIAARGIDVDGVSHVINFDLPNEPESYVHRVGRTGRAGARGQAISFCDKDERGLLKDIERLLQKRLSVVDAGVI